MDEAAQQLRFTSEHEWARVEGGLVRVGITHHAQEKLGDVVFVELPAPGTAVRRGVAFGVVESVKAVSELFSPLSGTVVEVNAALGDQPELVNSDCYGSGWMVLIQPAALADVEGLLTAQQYQALLSGG